MSNTETQDSQPININISTKENEKKGDEYANFKEYIILNNITLQKEVKEANQKIKILENEVQSKEENEDKYDTRIRYLKGLLQNLNELRSDYNNVSEKTEEKLKMVQDLHKKNKKNYYEIYALLIIINILTLITPQQIYYTNIFILLLQTSSSIIIPYNIYKIKEKYCSIKQESKEVTIQFKNITSQINKIKDEIKKTEDSCISLDNWVNEA
jgi:FtsZ-binding cell division protein ZapB